MKVLAKPEVTEYIESLVPILYEKGCFSYKEAARKYVIKDLYDDIKTNLPKKRHKPAPSRYDKYGEDVHYASFTKNKRTTWYAFFTKYEENGEIIYLVCYIGNNHTEAHHLYEGFL
jgi:hypothetical protein